MASTSRIIVSADEKRNRRNRRKACVQRSAVSHGKRRADAVPTSSTRSLRERYGLDIRKRKQWFSLALLQSASKLSEVSRQAGPDAQHRQQSTSSGTRMHNTTIIHGCARRMAAPNPPRPALEAFQKPPPSNRPAYSRLLSLASMQQS
jgi:hypothetical protein